MIEPGGVNILSVGDGHIKLTFDTDDEVEKVRAARIVSDMLRRGYALLIAEEGPDGKPRWTRAKAFDEATCEYIIADYAPELAEPPPPAEPGLARINAPPPPENEPLPPPPPLARGKGGRRRVKAADVEMTAVGRTAGG